MKILVDSQETATLLKQMVDIALKAGGLQNLQGCVAVLNSIVVGLSAEAKDPGLPPQITEGPLLGKVK